MTSKNVLLVDDSSVLLEMYANALRADPRIRVVEVKSGGDALDKLVNGDLPFHCIVTDYAMPPNMNGIELLRAVKADPRFKDIPVVVHTSDNDFTIETQAISLGAAAVLTKGPGRLAALVNEVYHLLGLATK